MPKYGVNPVHPQQRSPCMSLVGSIQSYLFRYSLSHLENKDTIAELFNYVKFALQQCRKVRFRS